MNSAQIENQFLQSSAISANNSKLSFYDISVTSFNKSIYEFSSKKVKHYDEGSYINSK